MNNCQKPTPPSDVISTDIENFWSAYDKIKATPDSSLHMQILEEEFLKQGTPGLEAIREVRQYTAQEYLDIIYNFPLFWASIRPNMEQVKEKSKAIAGGIQQLRENYPELKPAKVYFSVGAFRTGGTTLDSMVLIGSEISLADENAVTREFPHQMGHLPAYFATNPVKELVFLNVHEYVHTQQVEALEVNLLAQSLREGIAEFVAVQVLNQASPNICTQYGLANDSAVKEQFSKEMFNTYYSYWLWTNIENQFGVRDLGYYPGYAIAAQFYETAPDKKQALKTLIELDYTDTDAVEQFVDETGYFDQTIALLKTAYQNNRPQVSGIREFTNGSTTLPPGQQTVTIEFSEPMDTGFRGFELGPLGKENVLAIQNFIGFAADSLSLSFEAQLEPNKRYQIELSGRFRNRDGQELAPYLINVRTGGE